MTTIPFKKFNLISIFIFMLLPTFLLSTGCSKSKSKTIIGTTPNGSNNPNTGYESPTWEQGVYEESWRYYQICANPRTGTHPLYDEPFEDEQGTLVHEKMFIRSLMHETYLWYDEVIDQNPNFYTPQEYFDSLVVAHDRFSHTISLEEYMSFYEAGIVMDYGFKWQANAERTELYVAFVEPGSLNENSVERGDQIIAVNGVRYDERNLSNANYYDFYSALYPSEEDATYTFTLLKKSTGEEVDVDLNVGDVIYDPVPEVTTISTADGLVGYLLFNDHTNIAQDALYEAVTDLKSQNISDLILDLRFNLGGRLSAASQLAYMVAGQEQSQDKTFFSLLFNDKAGDINPITGQTNTPTLFLTQLLDDDTNQPTAVMLPTLDLPRVYVLTSNNTCSASEAVINGLNGIGVEVYQFGTGTCGKPYGYYSIENCGTMYNFMQFKGANHLGYGDYDDGFIPDNNEITSAQNYLPGCVVEDDFQTELGNEFETLISAALQFRSTGVCPQQSVAQKPAALDFEPMLAPAARPMFYSKSMMLPAKPSQLYRRSN